MRTLLVLFLACIAAVQVSGQVATRVGLRLGVSTSDLSTEEFRFQSQGRDFGITLEEARYGIHGGLFVQVKINKFVLQPELLFTSSRNDYRLRDFSAPSVIESIREESFQQLDLPLMLGYKWGPLRLQGGPVGHVHINSSSELAGTAGYESNFEQFYVGYQAGIGLDLWNVLLDFKYQSSFNDVGSHLSFGGQTVAFDTNPSQLVMSVGFSFN